MKTQRPIIHGRDHAPGGADPILPVFGDTNEGIILATMPGAYYKLNETTSDWADSSEGGRTLTHLSRTGELRGEPSDFDEADSSLCVFCTASRLGSGAPETHVGERTDTYFGFPGDDPFTVSARIKPETAANYFLGSDSYGICGTIDQDSGGWSLTLRVDGTDEGFVRFRRRGVGGSSEQTTCEDPSTVVGDSWYRFTGTFDGTDMRLYQGTTLVDTDDSSAVDLPVSVPREQLTVGAAGVAEGIGGAWAPWRGWIDSVIIWDRALSGEEIASIAAGADSPTESGYVLTTDGVGGMFWAAPTIEVDY